MIHSNYCKKMNKISILDTFAADAINAPAMITGGGKCKGKSKKGKSKKGKSKKGKSKSKSKSKSYGSRSNNCCVPCIPTKW